MRKTTLSEFFQEKYQEIKPIKKSEEKEKKEFVQTLMYGLSAPFVFPNQWGDSIPKATRELAKTYRLAELPKIIEEKRCSKFEAMMYLSCCSLTAPLNHEAYKMMMYCMKKYYGLEKIATDEQDLKRLENDAILYENEEQEFNRLREYIFKRQIEVVKSER